MAVPALSSDVEALTEGNTAFALDLYKRLHEREGNLFLSPYSISVALGMTYAGAGGETAAQMQKALHFELDQTRLHPAFKSLLENLNARQKNRKYELRVANALWAQKGVPFVREFLDLTQTHYRAGLNSVDFVRSTETARQTINGWVEKETRKRIKELIQRGILTKDTALVLTNAIYFKGDWACQFDKKGTRTAPFLLLTGKKIPVPMMHQTEEFGFTETEQLKIVELPYLGKELAMIVLLPSETDGLSDVEKSLTIPNITKWLKGLRRRDVAVYLPKYRISSAFRLDDTLKSLGMNDAFIRDRANFSGMLRGVGGPVWLQAIVHKAFVDVDEEGTEAAAATAVDMGLGSVAAPPVVFRADHPFIFLIRDKRSGSILFLGRVVNPKE